MRDVPETRFASNDGLTIAYQVVGDGPIDIVVVPGFMSHVELNWEYPFYSTIFEALTEFARLIVLDKRGTGLSDRSLGLGTLEERMSDVRAVMDAAGSHRAALLGISEGAAMTSLMAASHPDRVSALVLVGAYCCGAPPQLTPDRKEQLLDFIESRWHSGEVLDFFVQRAPDQSVAIARLARFERYCCTPSVAREIMRRNIESDIRAVLPTVAVPTIVVHQEGDPVCPIAHGQYYADHIPNAVIRRLDGAFHGSWRPADMASTIVAVREFLTGEPSRDLAVPERSLATVLFTDLVDSTATAAELGDARWREMLDRHDRAAREEIRMHGGVFVKSTGDGILARFDGPSRAVTCAHAMRRRVNSLGLDLRAGAHTGEIELRGDDIGGLGVHIASRVASVAQAGEVLVSRTVKDLTVGAGIEFDERGVHELKGVPDKWELFATMA